MTTTMTRPVDPLGVDLTRTLRALKLGGMADTLPERLHLARQQHLGHAAFLELVLSDEVTRRDTQSAVLRARTAGLDPDMLLERWDDTAKITYDRTIWNELCSLRFVDAPNDVVILGPVGVGSFEVDAAPAQRPLRTSRHLVEAVEGNQVGQQPRRRGPQALAR